MPSNLRDPVGGVVAHGLVAWKEGKDCLIALALWRHPENYVWLARPGHSATEQPPIGMALDVWLGRGR